MVRWQHMAYASPPGLFYLTPQASAGYTTYELAIRAGSPETQNVYTIFGDRDHPIRMPAAFQTEPPFGSNIGGIDPFFFDVQPASEYDSFLTMGITSGNSDNNLASIGIPFGSWTPDTALMAVNGAVFNTLPDTGPALGQRQRVTIAHLTVMTGQAWTATLNAQGRSTVSHADWAQDGIFFSPWSSGTGQFGFGSFVHNISCRADTKYTATMVM
jgi:hypothetical protein